MRKPDLYTRRPADNFPLPLPEPIVLGTAATEVVAGGIIRPGMCTTCGIMQPFPVTQVNF